MNVSLPTGLGWANINFVSSGGKVVPFPLEGLPPGALELQGKWVHVSGEKPLNGVFNNPPFLNRDKSKVTQDSFDQVQLYLSINNALGALETFGYDVEKILWGEKVVARANAFDDFNAQFSYATLELAFGKGEGKWHLASDWDISRHELFHRLFFGIAPVLRGKTADAVHEGGGDLLAAFLARDPDLAEDYVHALSGEANPNKGLRSVKNHLTLDQLSGEDPHEGGLVYGGWMWDIAKDFGLPVEKASDLGLKLLFNHAANYQSSRPGPKDVVRAMLTGAKALVEAGGSELSYKDLRRLILNRAIKRRLIEGPLKRGSSGFSSMDDFMRRFGATPLVDFFPVSGGISYLGGRQKIYQERYLSKTYGPIPLLGRAVFENEIQGGKKKLSVKDARMVQPGDINETVRFSPEEATLKMAQWIANALMGAEYRLEKLQRAPENSSDFGKLQRGQKVYRFLVQTQVELETQFMEDPNRFSWVIFPHGKTLVYQFVFLGFRFYVNAFTGSVSFR